MNRITMLAIMACSGVALAAGSAVAGEVRIVKAGAALDAVKVVRDKETGKLRAASPEEIEELSKLPSPALAPNIVVLRRPVTTSVVRPDGSATVRRSLDDLDSVVATRGADGKLVLRHAGQHGPAAAASNLPKE